MAATGTPRVEELPSGGRERLTASGVPHRGTSEDEQVAGGRVEIGEDHVWDDA